MNRWLILHDHSRFSEVLQHVLGETAVAVDIKTLVNEIPVCVNLNEDLHHQWWVSGHLLDDFHQRIIFQEVFFSVDSALYQYYEKDKLYVRHSWQAYLLSLFSCAKTVINPVSPQSLSISHYQFPRLLMLAQSVGFLVPRYEIGGAKKEGYEAVDSLWYWPNRRKIDHPIMNVERMAGQEIFVRFVRYDEGFIVCWPPLPTLVQVPLLKLCHQLEVYVGEVFFRKGKDWCFYGLRPQLQTQGCSDAVLLEIAECLRDIGNEEII